MGRAKARPLCQTLDFITSVNLIEIEATPSKDSDAFHEYGGAHVNAYVAVNSRDEALVIATKEIESAGWMVVKVESMKTVKRGELETAKGREYFDQCLLDGCVLVLHVWPLTEQSSNQVH